MVRVRYAPSPTGTLHIGGARTALFNFLFARHMNGVFVLRVEDTDQARQVPGSEEAMMRGLKSLGILWDEGPDTSSAPYGPYRVTERRERHQALARQLLDEGKAYRCFCTPEQLDADRNRQRAEGLPPRYSGRCRNLDPKEASQRAAAGDRAVVRLKVPQEGETVVDDIIRGTVRFENRILDDFVLMKPDFTPVYNFAVAIDDYDMAISHVIRGEEHLSNTPKQILVMEALGFDLPAFAHLPMILAPDRTKLSKRHGATSVEEYRDQGILPEALANYLLLLGWSTPDGREILSLDEACREFTLERVQHTAAIYDQKKLEWMNHEYFLKLPLDRLVEAVVPFVHYDMSQGPDFREVVLLSKERAYTLVQLADAMRFFYEKPTVYDAKGVTKHFGPGAAERLESLADRLAGVDVWNHDTLLAAYDAFSQDLAIKRAELIHPTRLAVTGRTVGPGLFELVALLGKDETITRLREAATLIRAERVPVNV